MDLRDGIKTLSMDGADHPRLPARPRRRRPAARLLLRGPAEPAPEPAPRLHADVHPVAAGRRPHRHRLRVALPPRRDRGARTSTRGAPSSSGTSPTARTGSSRSWPSRGSRPAATSPGRTRTARSCCTALDRFVQERVGASGNALSGLDERPHDLRGGDHLAGVALGVLGGVEEEPEHRARQAGAPDRARLEERRADRSPAAGPGPRRRPWTPPSRRAAGSASSPGVPSVPAARRWASLKRLAARVGEEPVEAARDVAQVEADGRRAPGARPELLLRQSL